MHSICNHFGANFAILGPSSIARSLSLAFLIACFMDVPFAGCGYVLGADLPRAEAADTEQVHAEPVEVRTEPTEKGGRADVQIAHEKQEHEQKQEQQEQQESEPEPNLFLTIEVANTLRECKDVAASWLIDWDQTLKREVADRVESFVMDTTMAISMLEVKDPSESALHKLERLRLEEFGKLRAIVFNPKRRRRTKKGPE